MYSEYCSLVAFTYRAVPQKGLLKVQALTAGRVLIEARSTMSPAVM